MIVSCLLYGMYALFDVRKLSVTIEFSRLLIFLRFFLLYQ